ncbi:3-keto-5-aminohexanoate cleavage protein [Mesorhizobium xinjiangense]|uniref:3-keto-5-aminohexanoate cleavage protein n=1 Tax=Mesorhizobium xinjiangense TaxID=2678685 RepID=UPI0012ED97DB|nr:3-keto-5-aminohexanoate cleavage protein [Mesorhizobium xinjiangense]
MIVQACLNGARQRGFHPQLPLTVADLARDGAACVAAGAAELHLHPRASDGRESLAAVDETMPALRRACPGTLIGVSTGAWIEADEARTREAIAGWRELPDYASVNLAEPDAPGVMNVLRQRGVGIEAGLASVADAERLVKLDDRDRVLRILIEIEEQALEPAYEITDGIAAVLERAGMRRPVLLHGFDATVWPFVELARERRWSTRVGLEDGKHLADGAVAPDNTALVAAAVAIFANTPAGEAAR